MGTRYALTVGGLFAGFIAAVLLAAPRRAASDGPPGESRLLVASDVPTRARVLEALRPLGVRVYDLATMQLVSEPTPTPGPATIGPRTDVRPAWTAISRSIGAVRASQDVAAITLLTFLARGPYASVHVSAATPVAVDALVKALGEQPGVEGVRLQGEAHAGDRTDAKLEFRAAVTESPHVDVIDWTRDLVPPLRNAIVGAHGAVKYLSPATREGDGWSTLEIRVQLPVGDRVETLLDEVAGVPNVRVVGLTWAPVERERIVDLGLTLAIRAK